MPQVAEIADEKVRLIKQIIDKTVPRSNKISRRSRSIEILRTEMKALFFFAAACHLR